MNRQELKACNPYTNSVADLLYSLRELAEAKSAKDSTVKTVLGLEAQVREDASRAHSRIIRFAIHSLGE